MCLLPLIPACAPRPVTSAAPTSGVRIERDALNAAFAILTDRKNGRSIAPERWTTLFASNGYRKLAERETAMGRTFTEDGFRAFLMSDTLLARYEELERAARAWSTMNVEEAARYARSYLPTGTQILTTVYPLIKPVTNSFVHRSTDGTMGIFMYLDTQAPAAELRTTLSHELHHIGLATACTEREIAQTDPALRTLLIRLGAFGEGIAMLAAAGAPTINPNIDSRQQRLAEWNASISDLTGFRDIETYIRDVRDKRITDPDSITRKSFDFYGNQGPWYTVGWTMASSVERAFGRPHLIPLLCDPVALMRSYNEAAPRLGVHGRQLPRWSEDVLQFVTAISP